MKDIYKREKILHSAAKIFSLHGYNKAKIDDIASDAEIGKGTIYLYFKSKKEIYETGIEYFAKRRVRKLNKLLKKYKSPQKKLNLILNLSIRFAQKDKEIFFMNYASLMSPNDSIDKRIAYEFFAEYLKLVEEIIFEGIKKSVFRKCDAKVAALAVVLTQDVSNLVRKDKKIPKNVRISKELINLIKK